ncbi:hypothetical protein FRB94_003974 [Tulasnella sp. JGI-2019a]|nr:hypothetical protein FRB94_003974 [Tulasnella sp. JGI-2019a]
MKMLPLSILLSCLVGKALALENGLARTPQMGWNTWNYFSCGISEDTILSAAQALVDTGLKKLGYEYVLIDDCWHAPTRNATTNAPVVDPERFPNGMKHVSDAVHKLGLKIGIYSDAGTRTCANRFGSLGYEEIDAKQYAEWEIDYLKYDNCYNEGLSGTPTISRNRYLAMSEALNKTGRPILYSMWEDGPWNWAPTIANSWRISGDIHDSFNRFDERCPCTDVLDCKLAGYHCAVMRIVDFAAPLGQKGGPGHFNDLDMLEVGNGGMTYDEYVTHFSMWAILKSPLILGNDLTAMDDETFSIISNEQLISINQDPMGGAANRIWKNGDLQLWVGWLVEWETVVAIINTGDKAVDTSISIADVFVDGSENSRKNPYKLYDLWQRQDGSDPRSGRKATAGYGKYEGVVQGHINKVHIKPHQTRVFKLGVIWGAEAARKQRQEDAAAGIGMDQNPSVEDSSSWTLFGISAPYFFIGAGVIGVTGILVGVSLFDGARLKGYALLRSDKV